VATNLVKQRESSPGISERITEFAVDLYDVGDWIEAPPRATTVTHPRQICTFNDLNPIARLDYGREQLVEAQSVRGESILSDRVDQRFDDQALRSPLDFITGELLWDPHANVLLDFVVFALKALPLCPPRPPL
jgi:hypothetical protein